MTLRRSIPFWNRKVGGGGLSYTPPLDVYTGSKRAYGFRLLRTAYTGALFQLTKAIGGDTLDVFPLSNGLMDEAAILTFTSGGSDTTTISIIYDQSGNGFNMPSYFGNSNLPFVLPELSSVFEKINGKNALKTFGGYFYDNNAFMYAAAANSFVGVFQGPNTNPNSACLVGEGRSASNNPAYFHSIKFNSTSSTQASHFVRNDANVIVRTSNVDSMGALYDNNPHIMYRRDNGSNFRAIIDNVSDLNTNYTRSGTLTLDRFGLLAGQRIAITSPHNDLKMGEIIFYDSNKDADALGLISNLNDYYSTY